MLCWNYPASNHALEMGMYLNSIMVFPRLVESPFLSLGLLGRRTMKQMRYGDAGNHQTRQGARMWMEQYLLQGDGFGRRTALLLKRGVSLAMF